MCRRRAPPRITTTAAVRSAAPSAVRPGTPRRARPVPADGLRVGGVGSGGSTTRPSLTAPDGSTGAEQVRRGASEKLCFAATVMTRQPVAGNLVVVAGLGHEPVAGHTQTRSAVESACGDADCLGPGGVPEPALVRLTTKGAL